MITKKEAAAILDEIGTLLELKGDTPFKTRAYANAARAIEKSELDLPAIVEQAKAKRFKGIGEGIAKKLQELV